MTHYHVWPAVGSTWLHICRVRREGQLTQSLKGMYHMIWKTHTVVWDWPYKQAPMTLLRAKNAPPRLVPGGSTVWKSCETCRMENLAGGRMWDVGELGGSIAWPHFLSFISDYCVQIKCYLPASWLSDWGHPPVAMSCLPWWTQS